MNEIAVFYFSVIIAEIAIIYVFARQGFHWLNVLLITNMLAVNYYAKLEVQYPFGNSNMSNLFYAFVVPIQFLILKNYGNQASRRVLRKCLLILAVMAFYKTAILFSGVAVEGNEEVKNAYRLLGRDSLTVLAASFLGFYFSFLFFLVIVEKMKRQWYSYPVGLIAWQVIDSLIFFPALFLTETGRLASVSEFIRVGLAVKILIGLLMIPVIFFKAKK